MPLQIVPEPLNFQHGPEVFLNALKMKSKGEFCCVCKRIHERAGAYICLNCGSMICVLSSLGQHGTAVIQAHARSELSGKSVKCGPAIKISDMVSTCVRVRKIK